MRTKEDGGITLIALVLTIIVLLILTGISISMLTGENGILNKAIEAKEKTEKSQKEEQAELATIEAISKGINVGTTVEYIPKGKYNWKADYSGGDNDIELNSEEADFKVTLWKILSLNNGKATLIAEDTSKGNVQLKGAQGYNNGVKLLNDACSNLYGNNEKGINSRNLNIEDIEKYMLEEKLKEVYLYKEYVQYGSQVLSPYTTNVKYPAIYEKEKLSVINGIEKTDGLGKSEQVEFIDKNAQNSNEGIIPATSIQPYQQYWRKNNDFMKSAFKNSNVNYYDLLIKTSSTYWLSTRSINTSSTVYSFDIRKVYYGEISANSMFSSIGINGNWSSIFPIITVNLDNIHGNEEDGFVIE